MRRINISAFFCKILCSSVLDYLAVYEYKKDKTYERINTDKATDHAESPDEKISYNRDPANKHLRQTCNKTEQCSKNKMKNYTNDEITNTLGERPRKRENFLYDFHN